MKNLIPKIAFVAAVLAMTTASNSYAESALDSIIQAKTLRCGVMLDNPPSGFLDASNKPDGFDVQYCKDMADALGVEPVIVDTPSPDRIPSLVSNRIDVLLASTTPTPKRALTVAFTQPYMNNTMGVITRKETGVTAYADLSTKKLGGVVGSTTEQLLNKELTNGWASKGATYTGYASDAEAFLALQQGKVDAILSTFGVFNALAKSGQFPEFIIVGEAPISDMVSIAVRRDDQQFLNWAKMFVWQQRVSGRFAEVYKTYFGDGPLPSLLAEGVDF